MDLPVELIQEIGYFLDDRSCYRFSVTNSYIYDSLQRLLLVKKWRKSTRHLWDLEVYPWAYPWAAKNQPELLSNLSLLIDQWRNAEPRYFAQDLHACRWALKYRPAVLFDTFLKACKMGRLKVVKYLGSIRFFEGRFRTLVSLKGLYAVKLASKNGHLKVVKYICSSLVISDKDVHIAVKDALWDAVEQAVRRGHLKVVKYLCSLKCKTPVVDISASKNTLLSTASFFGHLEIVRYLCSFKKTDGSLLVDITTEHNNPIISACTNGHLGVVEYLCSFKKTDGSLVVDIAVRRNTPLIRAAENGHLEVVKYLCSLTSFTSIEIRADLRQASIAAYYNRHHKVVSYIQELLYVLDLKQLKEMVVPAFLFLMITSIISMLQTGI